MGLFGGLLGNASQKNIEKRKDNWRIFWQQQRMWNWLLALFRDLIVFTDKRLILVDKQGMTGKKTSYKSFPYRSISRFSVETAGHFDLDAELKIWVSSAQEPAEVLQFTSDRSVIAIQKALAEAVLR